MERKREEEGERERVIHVERDMSVGGTGKCPMALLVLHNTLALKSVQLVSI